MLEKTGDILVSPHSKVKPGDRLWCKIAGEKVYYTVITAYLSNAAIAPDVDYFCHKTINNQTLRSSSGRQYYQEGVNNGL